MNPKALVREAEALELRAPTVAELLEQMGDLIRRWIPFDRFGALALDPLTAVPIRVLYWTRMLPQLVPQNWTIELTDPRHGNIVELAARSRAKTSLLSHATRGALRESRRYCEILRPMEIGHELRVALRAGGMCWGFNSLMRDVRGHDFEPDEVELLGALSTPLAKALRRTLLATPPRPSEDDSPAVIVLSSDDRIVSCSDAIEPLLTELADIGVQDPERLPAALRGAALLTRRSHPRNKPLVRVRTRSGGWQTVRGTTLDGGKRVALIIEPNRPEDTAWLTLAGYGLSNRQCTTALHVARGLSTGDIAQALGISEYTVQDHLKAIFDKTGFSSRKELAARLVLHTGFEQPLN